MLTLWFLFFLFLSEGLLELPCLCCKTKVLFLSASCFALNSSFFFQTIMPKSIKVWLSFTSTYNCHKGFLRIEKTIEYSMYKIIIIHKYTNSRKLASYLSNFCEEGGNSFILIHLQCTQSSSSVLSSDCVLSSCIDLSRCQSILWQSSVVLW